jgi:hypothetical protein
MNRVWVWSNRGFHDGDTPVQSRNDLKGYNPTLYAMFDKI